MQKKISIVHLFIDLSLQSHSVLIIKHIWSQSALQQNRLKQIKIPGGIPKNIIDN